MAVNSIDQRSVLRQTALVLMVGASLSGCAANSLVSEEPDNEAPPNFTAIISAPLQKPKDAPASPGAASANNPVQPQEKLSFLPNVALADVQISDETRKVITNLHGWAWQACIRTNVAGAPRDYAVFVKRGQVIDARGALSVDQCDGMHYAPIQIKRPEPMTGKRKGKVDKRARIKTTPPKSPPTVR